MIPTQNPITSNQGQQAEITVINARLSVIALAVGVSIGVLAYIARKE